MFSKTAHVKMERVLGKKSIHNLGVGVLYMMCKNYGL